MRSDIIRLKYPSVSLLLVALTLIPLGANERPPADGPGHFELPESIRQASSSKEILAFSGTSEGIKHRLQLLLDGDGEPLLFHAQINAPVCIDNICKPLHIQLYWNLIGDYVGYGTVAGHPLTKFDHEAFEPKDHSKLHHLLQDRYSVLSTKEMSDLFDPNATPKERVKYQGVEVDAVTGATRKEIRESVVEGALYSCYTLWHLVHGEVIDDIRQYLHSIYSPTIAHRFLYGHDVGYQFHALKQMDDAAFARERDRVIEIFKSAQPLIRTYILKKLPPATLQTEEVTAKLFGCFPEIDVNTRTLLIQKVNVAHVSAMAILSEHLAIMTKNQLKLFLATMIEHPEALTPDIERRLRMISSSQDYAYVYLIEAFLMDRRD